MIVGHQKQWEYLKYSFENEQMAHAYLFCGENQIGKKTLAIEFVKLLNCIEKNKPCGVCKNCTDIEKGNFLDFLFLRTGEESINFEGMFSYNSALPDLKSGEVLTDKKEIGIDQARKVIEFLSKRSYFGEYKTVIIDNAEKLTIEAQNCLLKTLEEPKGKTILFLVTSQPDRLLTTIFSRCQIIKFFATKEILKVAESPEQIKKEKEILNELLKIISGSLAEKFAYTKNIKEEGGDVLLILKILQKHFREKILIDNSAIKKLKLLDELIYKITFTNASPKLALEILFLKI
jgi:DNA polymerase III delta' subunit